MAEGTIPASSIELSAAEPRTMCRRKEVVMRLDRYTLFTGIAVLAMTGCSTGRYASAPVSQNSHVAAPTNNYNVDPAPAPQPESALPAPTASEVSHVKSVGLISILSQTYQGPCGEETCAPRDTCETLSPCTAPEQPCCPLEAECAEHGGKCAPCWKKMFDRWHWPRKQSLCTPEPLCCAQKRQSCVTESPCVANTTCAVPERCQPVVTQDCCGAAGCSDNIQHKGIMSSLCDRLFRKHQTGCSSQPSCSDDCTVECGDICNNTCSPLTPQSRNAPCRPSHGGSPLAPCLEDPFVRHENAATADRSADPPAEITAPVVPPLPALNGNTPRAPGTAPAVQPPGSTLDPSPLNPAPQNSIGPQTYVEPQIWPRLKVAPIVRHSRQAATYPANWSR